jgi:hypothetical protein
VVVTVQVRAEATAEQVAQAAVAVEARQEARQARLDKETLVVLEPRTVRQPLVVAVAEPVEQEAPELRIPLALLVRGHHLLLQEQQ